MAAPVLPISRHDFGYIERRLLVPSTEALEATERLAKIGQADLASELAVAHAEFAARCRRVRRDLTERRRASLDTRSS